MEIPSEADPLRDALVLIAASPDDISGMDEALLQLTKLVVALVKPVDYASVTVERAGRPTTVAMSSELALAVDAAQYADEAGPCLDALATGQPVNVPDLTATVVWPRFRDAAAGLGLHGSLSLPIFAGSGFAIASLNLYARRPAALTALSAAVNSVFDDYHAAITRNWATPSLDPGGLQLVGALIAALQTHEQIQVAIGVIMEAENASRNAAYTRLREQAAVAGHSLFDAANEMLGSS